jgi:F-type H+-transporting ATPase subunit a
MKGCLYVIIIFVVVAALCGLSSGFMTSLGTPTLLDNVLGQPALPTVSLPAERITGSVDMLGFETGLTNTMVATILTDLILIVVAFFATRKIRSGSQEAWVPRGLQNAVEAIVEVLYGLAEAVLHKRAKQIFWLGATIFLLVWIANWLELVPGVDSIGWVEKPHEANITTYHKGEFLGLATVIGPAIPPKVEAPAASTGEAQPAAEEHTSEGGHEAEGYVLVPFVRASATDLNFTLALALISVAMVQVYGFRALGAGYLGKFVNTAKLGRGNPMGLLDLFVGGLESISEFSKIISFTFRLFGNIFAGQVLLFVMGFLIPFLFFGVLVFWGLEIFVGVIQAFVFMMLTFVFIAQATTAHGDHAEHSDSEAH